jgi:predicted PurR-regulated permease PerM
MRNIICYIILAAFCLLLLVCGAVIYWLVQQLQTVITDHKSLRDEHHAALTQIIEKQNEASLKLAVCIDRNSEALRECAFELRRFQERKET